MVFFIHNVLEPSRRRLQTSGPTPQWTEHLTVCLAGWLTDWLTDSVLKGRLTRCHPSHAMFSLPLRLSHPPPHPPPPYQTRSSVILLPHFRLKGVYHHCHGLQSPQNHWRGVHIAHQLAQDRQLQQTGSVHRRILFSFISFFFFYKTQKFND